MSLSAAEIRRAFDRQAPNTVGIEKEILLLDADTLEPAPVATAVIEQLDRSVHAKPELLAAQIELLSSPQASVRAAIDELAGARRALVAACDGRYRPIGAGAAPLGPARGTVSSGARYDAITSRLCALAGYEIVNALQIHVALGDADRTLRAYNRLRRHLPELLALAANAPFHLGRDTGLATIRPSLCTLIPRQGLPPAIPSWDWFADELGWGEAAGVLPDSGWWWWELRPHLRHGTLEVRVPDTQATLADTAAIAAFAHCLVVWAAEQEPLADVPAWRLAEQRWSALRYGVTGSAPDIATGAPTTFFSLLEQRISDLTPVARQLACVSELEDARHLVRAGGGATRQRAAGDARAASTWLADTFVAAET